MKRLNLVVVFCLAIVVIAGCRNTREKRAENLTEKIVEKTLGDNADIDVNGETFTIKTEQGTIITNTGDHKWPAEIPSEIPEFNYGSVENVSLRDFQESKIWSLLFIKVPVNALEKYQSDLQKAGFKTRMVGEKNNGGMLNAEKEKLSLAVLAGEGNASVSVMLEK